MRKTLEAVGIGGGDTTIITPPPILPPTPMPTPADTKATSRRKSALAASRRRGRESTILTGDYATEGETLG